MKQTSDIVAEAARRANTSGALAKDVVQAALESITASLLRGEDVHLRGLGVLRRRWCNVYRINDVRKGAVEGFRRYPQVTFRQTRVFKERLRQASQYAQAGANQETCGETTNRAGKSRPVLTENRESGGETAKRAEVFTGDSGRQT